MSPEWGTSAQDLPPETQFMLLELAPKGPYAVLLPLIDSGKFRATLRPPRRVSSQRPVNNAGGLSFAGVEWVEEGRRHTHVLRSSVHGLQEG